MLCLRFQTTLSASIYMNINDNQIFLGYPREQISILEKYRKSNSELYAEDGFHKDCFGVKTRLAFFDGVGLSALYTDLPFPDNGLYGEMIEILSTCVAIEGCGRSIVVYEMGAGFAPWLVLSADFALKRGVDQLKLVAVEADPERLPLIGGHFRDNGLPAPGEAHPVVETVAVHAAVSDVEGELHFAAQGIKDWGGGARVRRAMSIIAGSPARP